jgi:VIT1/CCC1 family predicted Fe2+/Mn2+ transporter
MTIGAAGVIAGLPILLLMVLGTQSITGIVVSSLAISFGLALVLTGYFWFTF